VEAARRHPDRLAAKEPAGAAITYRELDTLSNGVRDALLRLGLVGGDRVGVYLHKSVDGLAAILGILKAGAAYVPVDPESPPARAASILEDCAVRLVVTDHDLAPALRRQYAGPENVPEMVELVEPGGGRALAAWLTALAPLHPTAAADPDPDAPAYLLYTSGSTGKPKGVVVSHRSATAFVDWCSDSFSPTPEDRFSSHAPFHFDLSIHDLFVSLKHGASVLLIGDDDSKNPQRLASLIARERITIWYSTPSILALLEEHGRLERHDCRSLRYVLFAGEVFPIPSLRRLLDRWPEPQYFNLYGPTETNVCTWYAVPRPFSEDQTDSLPIGQVCAHYRALVVDGHRPVEDGQQGELLISGPGIMTGYWDLPDRTATAFLVDAHGTRWYRTGDIVSRRSDGVFLFHGRRDRMIKRQGYRIELGEVEAALARHPGVSGAAAVSRTDPSTGRVMIVAFLTCRPTGKPSILDLKAFCRDVLPRYMTPDRFMFLDAIPQTSTNKTDYETLRARE
jgi:amino acid adenylation domain-containing protein